MVDARGRFVKELGSKSPYPGNNIHLSLNRDIQAIAEKTLGGETGCILISDPRTGEILAMVSHPDFDPNIFFLAQNRVLGAVV